MDKKTGDEMAEATVLTALCEQRYFTCADKHSDFEYQYYMLRARFFNKLERKNENYENNSNNYASRKF